MKKVLILNASHNDLMLILALKNMGCHIISTGYLPDLPGHRLCDEYRYGDYSDREAMLRLATDNGIDAICPCCNDFGVITAAYVAEKLGLPGHDSLENTLTIHHKDRFRRFAEQLGLPIPLATPFDSEDEAMRFAMTEDRSFPLMVKAVDLSAGNGIFRVTNRADLMRAIKEAFQKSRIRKIVIEEWVSGTQHGFCTYLLNGRVVAVCTNNEYAFANPYRVECDTFPATLPSTIRASLIGNIENIAKALNLKDGIFHLQLMAHGENYYILECMRRVLGNMYGIPATLHCSGFNWDYWEARARCGFDLDELPLYPQETGFYSYRAFVADEPGVFSHCDIHPDIQKHLYSIHEIRKPGYHIERNQSDPMGIGFFSFENQGQMQDAMKTRHRDIRVHTRPDTVFDTLLHQGSQISLCKTAQSDLE